MISDKRVTGMHTQELIKPGTGKQMYLNPRHISHTRGENLLGKLPARIKANEVVSQSGCKHQKGSET